MLTRFRVRNFKCLKDVTLEGLRPFNVLIGPNDTGKSSVLEALGVLSRLPTDEPSKAFSDAGLNAGTVLCQDADEPAIEFESSVEVGGHRARYRVAVDSQARITAASLEGLPDPLCFKFPKSEGDTASKVTAAFGTRLGELKKGDSEVAELVQETVRSISSIQYRLDPKALSKPAPPVPEMDVPDFQPNGEGIASVLNYLLVVKRERFDSLQKQLRSIVSHIREVNALPKAGKRQIAFYAGQSKEPIWAPMASDGLLLFVGYLILLHLPRPAPGLILIDEPENGIHPKRLEEVVKLLRDLCQHESVQIIITTHSPYLLDWVEPEEVHIFTRSGDLSTSVTRMADVPDIETLRKGYHLGELWFNYGEEALINGVK